MVFNNNIKILRQRKNRTQDIIAGELNVSRSTVNSYENGSIKNPTLDALMMFSKYYKVSIDTLVKIDLSKLSEFQLSELERGNDVYVTGSRLRVIATTVDSQNRENIEVVPLKAKAGYKNGFADPEFIKKLPTFQLPILFNDRKYRMFQISGDSMLPIPDKSYVIAEYLENWYDIKDGEAYVLLTQEEGIVFKMVENNLKKKRSLTLKSLNTIYNPYDLNVSDIKEVWKFCNYMSTEIPESNFAKDELIDKLSKLETEVQSIRNIISN
ncbi:MAG TPA: helix-turn-helix domain-containing protein [Bacteroidia bacterium]|jgi:transcriptional regulator with XRE-family HTH domain|nr:helix-turn-helix domain-containing protein [Bacteroidota bacterium]MBP6649539.1 helix-turn-helix domain-containing protein [Bacteroidia bacterium]MBK7431744.1 helix-turn-helix domain-containing protein [Bacteroidota bacterium]MBK7570837.1 helix-turn-helix domain-containing protein [Bacteroidota bacterium]MBK8587498.1 helix-turn-helix domain-containing protein [Bacteroidota bacterium]